MKTQLRKLNLLFRLTRLNPDMFYAITVYESYIQLQGCFRRETVKSLYELFPNAEISKDGYAEFSKNGIKITLT